MVSGNLVLRFPESSGVPSCSIMCCQMLNKLDARLQKLYNSQLLSWEAIIRKEMKKMDVGGLNVKSDIDKSKEALN